MAVTLDYIIDVNILTGAASVVTADFSTILLLAEGATFAGAEKGRLYESAAAVAADGDLDAATKAYAAQLWAQTQNPGRLIIGESAGLDYSSDLDDILATRTDWYAVCSVLKVAARMLEMSTWVASNAERICLIQSLDANILSDTTPNELSAITDLNHTRTLFMWHDNNLEAMDLAWGAFKLSADPDVTATSWPHCSLVGVPIDDMTATQRANCLDNLCNVNLNLGGVPATFNGSTCGDVFIDTVVSGDWLAARVQEGIAQLFLDVSALNSKIPYTDAGIAQIASVLRKWLGRGEGIGHFRPGSSTVTVPLLSSIPSATIAARTLTISGTTILAGAIDQAVTVNIAVTDS
jgi:hypothetical protein